MQFFRKKNTSGVPYDFLNLYQDIHCHLLPGIDDGSPDIETSVELIKSLGKAGIHKFICTPHIIGDLYRNTPQTINYALDTLRDECTSQNIHVTLSAAAEYMMDDYFMDLLRRNEPLLTLYKNYVLTELSFATAPDNLEKISFELNIQGYQPIMAHPERYLYYHKNFDAYYRMKDLGFSLQVNLLSLTGYYGKSVAKAAQFIIENNIADFVGSDLHHFNHLNALIDENNGEIFRKFLGGKVYNRFDL